MSGERILNFKSARGLGKNILQKETRIFLVWLKYQKWKYVIDLRLLGFQSPSFSLIYQITSDSVKIHVTKCYGGYWERLIARQQKSLVIGEQSIIADSLWRTAHWKHLEISLSLLRWLPRVFTNNPSYQAYVTEGNLVTLSLRFCSRDSPLRLPI